MARYLAGGTDDDYVSSTYLLGSNKLSSRLAGAVITFYDAFTGGNQVTDLLAAVWDSGTKTYTQGSAVTSVTADASGYWGPVWWPDGVTELWAQAVDPNKPSGSPRRFKVVSVHAAANAVADAETAASNASTSASNASSSASAAAASAQQAAAPTDDMVSSLVPSSSGSKTSGALSTAFAPRLPGATANSKGLDFSTLKASAGAQITIPTGYATNDVVEPTVLFDERAPFLGYEYVMCASPYYQSNTALENPCLWVSHDGNTWVAVVNGTPTPGYSGTATPIIAHGAQGDGDLSDQHISQGPDGTYYVLTNQNVNASPTGTGTGGNNWAIKGVSATSLAGPWTTPVTLLATTLSTARPSSPSMFWDGGLWHMYCVDLTNTSATKITHYTNPSKNPLAGTWTKQADPSIPLPSGYTGQVWWHLNAYLIGKRHVLIVQDSPAGASAGGNLWALVSDDAGATWTVPATPMVPSARAYRSAVVPTPGGFDLFYSLLNSTWDMFRGSAVFGGATKYGGAATEGLPVNALAVLMAKTNAAPYKIGDTAVRADSATTPGNADSGQAWTVDSGTIGISGNQIYVPTPAGKAHIATTGLADGAYTCEMSAVDLASQAWLLARYVDANNYIRFGYSTSAGLYQLQNVVGGAVSQTAICFGKATAGDVLAVVCSGSNVSAYLNGVLVGKATGWTSNQSGSGIGFQANSTVCRLRNFTARPLVNGA